MLRRLRRGLVWLLAALLVLGALAGCAGNTGGTGTAAPTKQSSQVVSERIAGDETEPGGRPSAEAGGEAEPGGQPLAETGGEAEPGGQMSAETGGEAEPGSQPSAKSGSEFVAELHSGGVDDAGQSQDGAALDERGSYTSKDQVALYLYTYGHLPDNYITKKEAESLGWDSKKGNLREVAPGMSIGGSYFGNYEGKLPEKQGRRYYECDVNYEGGYRGAERIIYSDDGLIFYTGDHYENFEQLYPE